MPHDGVAPRQHFQRADGLQPPAQTRQPLLPQRPLMPPGPRGRPAQLIYPLAIAGQQLQRRVAGQGPLPSGQRIPPGRHLPGHQFRHPCPQAAHQHGQFPPVGHGGRRSARGRRGAPVGDEVGDGEVGLVAYAADDGDGRSGDGPRHPFVVEGPQLFQRAAAAGDDDHVQRLSLRRPAVQRRDRGDDLRWGVGPLHQRGRQQDVGQGVADAQRAQDVSQRRRPGRGDHANAPRQRWQRPLALLVEESLLGQFLLERLELQIQPPQPGRLQDVHVELVDAPLLINGDGAVSQHGLAVARQGRQKVGLRAPHDAIQRRPLVLQREVAMA